jgi:hypothetical protein
VSKCPCFYDNFRSEGELKKKCTKKQSEKKIPRKIPTPPK